MFKNLGTPELLLIAIVLVILFGTNKLTELARGAGTASRELKKAKSELDETVKEVTSNEIPPKKTKKKTGGGSK